MRQSFLRPIPDRDSRYVGFRIFVSGATILRYGTVYPDLFHEQLGFVINQLMGAGCDHMEISYARLPELQVSPDSILNM